MKSLAAIFKLAKLSSSNSLAQSVTASAVVQQVWVETWITVDGF